MKTFNLIIFLFIPLDHASPRTLDYDSKRISEGKVVNITSHPYHAVVLAHLLTGGSRETKFCGGTIISDRWILTAAHCHFVGVVDQAIEVFVGLDDGRDIKKRINVQGVTSIALPPGFNVSPKDKHFHHNIAILEIGHPLSFNERVKPVLLPDNTSIVDEFYENVSLIVTGFVGDEDLETIGHAASGLLEAASLPLTNTSFCSRFFGNHMTTPDTLCILGGTYYPSVTCSSDAGGGAMVEIADGQFMIIGVISFGAPCGLQVSPQMLTRVASYIEWIKSVINRSLPN